MQHQKTHSGYLLIIDRGEEVITSITEFCKTKDIKNAHLSAIGAVDRLSCGYYALDEKRYYFKRYDQMLEVVSATGNVILKDAEPFVHLHAIFTDTENKAFGGHVEEMRVGVTLEVILTILDSQLSRELHPTIGLALISCPAE